MNELDMHKRMESLALIVRSKYFATLLILADAAKKYQGNSIPLHKQWCPFKKDSLKECECGAFEFDAAVELLKQVESREI